MLPIGISFFTFQAISYVDRRRTGGEVRSSATRWISACTSRYFPQLIAGPIVRYHDVDPADRARRTC